MADDTGLVLDDPDAGIVYIADDGVATYRASSLSSCHNALLLARLGYDAAPPPEWLQKRFDAGHDHEPLILARLTRDHGFNLVGAQDTVNLAVGSGARIRGHVDGLHESDDAFPILITHLNGEPYHRPFLPEDDRLVVVDAKALAVSTFDAWSKNGFDEFEHYAWQQRAYMLGTNAVGLVMAVKNKNTDELRVEYFDNDFMDRKVKRSDLIRKVIAVEAAAKIGAEAVFANPCTPMYPCPYFFMHPNKETDNADHDMDKVGELVTLRQAEKARADVADVELKRAKAAQKKYDDEIRKALGNVKTTVKTADETTVTTYLGSSSSVDWDALALEHGYASGDDAKKKFTVTKQAKQLSVRITPKKVK